MLNSPLEKSERTNLVPEQYSRSSHTNHNIFTLTLKAQKDQLRCKLNFYRVNKVSIYIQKLLLKSLKNGSKFTLNFTNLLELFYEKGSKDPKIQDPRSILMLNLAIQILYNLLF